jgi:glycosyltransferase involved in cell wall biosynthesis
MNSTIYINARFLTQKTTGVQRFAIELSKRLIKINPNIVFLSPSNIFNKELAFELKVKIIGKLSSHLWEQIELPLYLKSKGNPLLINFCNTGPLFYSNQIVTIHDLAFIINPKWFSKKFSLLYSFLIPKIATKAKQIFTVSNSSKMEIVKLLNQPNDKISVIYNGITFTNKAELYQKPLYDKKYFLTVCSIDPRKNLHKLIQAFDLLKNEDVDLLIIGGTNKSFANNFNKNINQQVKFLGYVNDSELINYYQNAVCFVYPSLYEGFGLPPLEALALGTKVIVSDIPSLREVCTEHALRYFNPNSTSSIIDALEFAIKDKEVFKAINIDKFSWQKSAENINEIISNILRQ